jgi:hypothetical protein
LQLNEYAESNDIRIPKYCSSIIEIFNEDYGEDFNLGSDESFSLQGQLPGNRVLGSALGELDERQSNHNNEYSRKESQNQNARESGGNSRSRIDKQSNSSSHLVRKKTSNLSGNPGEGKPYREFEPTSTYKPLERSGRRESEDERIPRVASQIQSQQQTLNNEQNEQSRSLQGSMTSKSVTQKSNSQGPAYSNYNALPQVRKN